MRDAYQNLDAEVPAQFTFEKILEEAQEIEEKYAVYLSYKTAEESVDRKQNFLLKDAVKTAEVLNHLSPVRVLASGLSIFPDTPLMEEVRRGEFVEATETEKIQELYTFVKTLDIHTLLDATNVSNMMPVYGHLPEDKEKILAMLKQGADEQGEERLRMRRDSMRSL
jgi:hypothetical protein